MAHNLPFLAPFPVPDVCAGGRHSGLHGLLSCQATEGTDIIDSEFNNHYEGATAAGFIRGGYHFAHPYQSDGATQADFFLAHGGGWTADGRTLPGMVDLESGESEGYPECWGLSQSEMIDWISSFSNQYQSSEGRPPMIYCSPSWWETCTGNTDDFTNNPLVEADWASSISTVPGGWPYESFWQYSDSYEYGGDADYWNGDLTNLKKFATG